MAFATPVWYLSCNMEELSGGWELAVTHENHEKIMENLLTAIKIILRIKLIGPRESELDGLCMILFQLKSSLKPESETKQRQ